MNHASKIDTDMGTCFGKAAGQLTDDLTSLAKYRCYGGKAAITFEAYESKKQEVFPTVKIDLAPKTNNSTLWDHKMIFRLEGYELPLLCGLMLGYAPVFCIKRDDKSLEIVRQRKPYESGGGNLFVKGSSLSKNYNLPIIAGHVFYIANLCLHQLKARTGFDNDFILHSIKSASALNLHSNE